jgi:glycosyltransferase involved in cell wall biosynthesis
MTKPDFTIVVPCYNEEGAILDVIQKLRMQLKGKNYEMIIVDDGSTDATAEKLREAMSADATLNVVKHDGNRGYGAALKTGCRRSKSELIVITDADGTYPNERIPELVEMAANADMVVGARTADDVIYPFLRKIPKLFLSRYVSWLAGQTVPDMNSGLRVIRGTSVERFMSILPNGFSFTTTITIAMLRNYDNVLFVPISYNARVGRSKIRPIRDTLNFIQLITRTGMYFAPLRLLAPVVVMLIIGAFTSLGYDIIVLGNITDKTIVLLTTGMNVAIFALLADMIDKRTG